LLDLGLQLLRLLTVPQANHQSVIVGSMAVGQFHQSEITLTVSPQGVCLLRDLKAEPVDGSLDEVE